MSIVAVPVGTNYVWLLQLPASRRCVVVDPTAYEPVQAVLLQRRLQPAAVLITHHHFDHVGGVAQLCDAYDALAVYAPAKERIDCVTRGVQQGDRLTWPGLQLRVIELPGHTLGHVAYVGHGVLLAGDTLFAAGCGRVFEGSMQQMYDSLGKLARLPGDTLLYCAHEYTYDNLLFARLVEPDNAHVAKRLQRVKQLRAQGLATLPCRLSLELLTNPFLRCHLPQLQHAAQQHCGKPLQTPAAVFAVLRRWKDSWQPAPTARQ